MYDQISVQHHPLKAKSFFENVFETGTCDHVILNCKVFPSILKGLKGRNEKWLLRVDTVTSFEKVSKTL